MFEGISNIASLMQTAQQIPAKMDEINQELQSKSVTGSAGGGMVTVQMNGAGTVTAVRIEEALIEQGDREMIEELLPAAINEATLKSRELYAEAMQGLAGSMPGMGDMLAKFTGMDPSSK